ncbi:MAG: hypothetical protein ACE5GT_12675 [Rhodospirillales bacterium]
MGKLRITIATSDYDHVRDLAMGRVAAEGIDINYLNFTVEEIFYRFTLNREWEVSEMSLAKFVAQVAGEAPDITGIPVFPSRVFRLSSIYLRKDKGITGPEQLRGKKVGVPEWAQTAAVYTRGYLVHEVGVALAEIDWVQAGVNEAGRVEKVKLNLPKGVRYTSVPDKSLSEMLLASELDAVMTAHPPICFDERHPDIVRLFPDYREAEEAYYERTGIFPIMHVIAIRKDVLKKNPWVARNLFTAFEEAKERSIKRALEVTASRFPIPWGADYAAKMKRKFAEGYFAYGVEPNRATLEAFLLYAHEQGVSARRLAPEELFPKAVQGRYKV